jgi:rubrerythrin
MKSFQTIDAALDFAIEREQEAVDFYLQLAAQTDEGMLKKTLTSFAGVEAGHKKKLQAAKTGAARVGEVGTVTDMKIGDYLIDVQPGPEMTLQDALIVAMKREKAAMDFYADLAENVVDAGLRTLFNQLAREEAAHKLSFEAAYEKQFLSDN